MSEVDQKAQATYCNDCYIRLDTMPYLTWSSPVEKYGVRNSIIFHLNSM